MKETGGRPAAIPLADGAPGAAPSPPHPTLPDAATDRTADAPEAPPRAPNLWRRISGRSLAGLFVLALLYTLWLAQSLILPVVLAVFLAIVLSAPVRLLRRLHLPDVLSAALVVLGFLAALGAGVYFLSAPALTWIDRAPQVVRALEYKLAPITRQLGGATRITREIEEMTTAEDGKPTVHVADQSLAATVVAQVGTMAAGGIVTIILLFFLLAMGRRTGIKVARALLPESRRVYEGIVTSVRTEIAAYLQTITAINIVLGLVTAGAMMLLSMPTPALWGVVAGVLNFMPYLGPVMTVSILTVVSVLTFDTFWTMAAPPLCFLVLTSLEGQIITPMIVGQRLTLNPLVVFLSVVAWGWLWGMAGALLAVPLVAVFKIVLDHTGRLRLLRAAME